MALHSESQKLTALHNNLTKLSLTIVTCFIRRKDTEKVPTSENSIELNKFSQEVLNYSLLQLYIQSLTKHLGEPTSLF